MRLIVKVLLLLLLALVLAGAAAWGALAIHYSDIRSPGVRSAFVRDPWGTTIELTEGLRQLE